MERYLKPGWYYETNVPVSPEVDGWGKRIKENRLHGRDPNQDPFYPTWLHEKAALIAEELGFDSKNTPSEIDNQSDSASAQTALTQIREMTMSRKDGIIETDPVQSPQGNIKYRAQYDSEQALFMLTKRRPGEGMPDGYENSITFVLKNDGTARIIVDTTYEELGSLLAIDDIRINGDEVCKVRFIGLHVRIDFKVKHAPEIIWSYLSSLSEPALKEFQKKQTHQR